MGLIPQLVDRARKADWADKAGIADTLADALDGLPITFAIIDIGPWNMDTTQAKTVPHGLTYANLIYAWAVVREDGDGDRHPLPGRQSQSDPANENEVSGWDATNVYLSRKTAGYFDSTDYDFITDDWNRGWIVCLIKELT